MTKEIFIYYILIIALIVVGLRISATDNEDTTMMFLLLTCTLFMTIGHVRTLENKALNNNLSTNSNAIMQEISSNEDNLNSTNLNEEIAKKLKSLLNR